MPSKAGQSISLAARGLLAGLMGNPIFLGIMAFLAAAALLMAITASVTSYIVSTMNSGADGSAIVAVAQAEYDRGLQDGTHNAGGAKYLACVGLSTGNPWCASFVTWCADQCGFVDEGLFPRTAAVASYLAFYRSNPDKGEVHVNDGNYHPVPGDLIVWRPDGESVNSENSYSHIGIVESYDEEAGLVHTIEGNSGDVTAKRTYSIGHSNDYFITPAYPASGGGLMLSDDVSFSMSESQFVTTWSPRIAKIFTGSGHGNAPLASYGDDFARSAYRNHVDPRLVAAISIVESGGGEHCWNSHNAWGWGAADGGYDYSKKWDSWPAAIETVTNGLSRLYSDCTSVEQIQARYCPYSSTWAGNVSKCMSYAN